MTHTTQTTPPQASQPPEKARRFAGAHRLYGEDFATAHVYVVGVGGVGSWAAEALARTGVGRIALIDMDVVALSNINRQLPALTDTLGESKIDVMAARIFAINPNCHVDRVDEFIDPKNVAALLPTKDEARAKKTSGLAVIDCTDDLPAKTAIALHCRFAKIPLVVCGAAGGKTDPGRIDVADLKDVYQDPLLAKLRARLRQKGINRDLREKFALKCVFSSEPPQSKKPALGGARLACQGYGSAVVVTASMGLRAAAECLALLQKP